jgi:hypothetical protein
MITDTMKTALKTAPPDPNPALSESCEGAAGTVRCTNAVQASDTSSNRISDAAIQGSESCGSYSKC